MTDYVLMPGTHYQEICEAVREKTGRTDLLRSGELAQEIQSIPSDSNDAFWDAYQQNGNRVNYFQRFTQDGWNSDTFHPQHPITCRDGATHGRSVFSYSQITEINVPVIVTGISAQEMFYRCTKLEKISRLVMEGVTSCSSMFTGCYQLQELNVEGSIDVDLSLAAAELLSEESVTKVLSCLKDLKEQPTQTLTLHSTAGEKISQEQRAAAIAKNWTLAY